MTKPDNNTKARQQSNGIITCLFRPLGIAIALLFSTYFASGLAFNFYAGLDRDRDYKKSYHIDHSLVELFSKSSIAKDQVELIIRNFDGELETRLASRSQVKSFLKQRSEALEAARSASKEMISSELKALFETAFLDREAAVNAYADWFFEWKRPYVILKEAITSTSTRLVKLGEYESLRTAVERDVTDYFMKHYQEQVLKPETRTPVITAGIERIARGAHQAYLLAMAEQHREVREFLTKNTRHLERVASNQKLTKTKLDWDTQRWKSPTYLMEDRALGAIFGVGGIAASGTLGGILLGPSVNRTLSGIFQPLARRFATSMGARITLAEGGAVAGTVVEPVGGTFVGAVIGVALGFAADYVANKLNEKFSREKFVTANQSAADETISQWQQKFNNDLSAGTDKWWDDAKASLILSPSSNIDGEAEVLAF